ncbi:hypothetical protein N431DRAFT_243817 [Stipitochalara longipes BDJ]|nr:hypothetical protein N431DRAFT_243817 [Stipitochalara longipes BDJ]
MYTSPASLILLSALLSTSSAQPLEFSSTISLTLPWHPPPPPNSDLRLKNRMQMPDSPQPPNPSSFRLGAQLPVSYRVAIAVDAFVLLITIMSLVGLGVYIRRQLRRRKDSLLHNQEEGYGFDSDDACSDDEGDIALEIKGEDAEGKVGGERRKKV